MKNKVKVKSVSFEEIMKKKTIGDVRKLYYDSGIDPDKASERLLKKIKPVK